MWPLFFLYGLSKSAFSIFYFGKLVFLFCFMSFFCAMSTICDFLFTLWKLYLFVKTRSSPSLVFLQNGVLEIYRRRFTGENPRVSQISLATRDFLLAPWCSYYHYCTIQLNKPKPGSAQVQVLLAVCQKFAMVKISDKAKRLSSVNHDTEQFFIIIIIMIIIITSCRFAAYFQNTIF